MQRISKHDLSSTNWYICNIMVVFKTPEISQKREKIRIAIVKGQGHPL